MIPIFEQGCRAALVERKDKPGLFGVAMAGKPFVTALPEGYDGLTALTVHLGWVLVAHPKLPALCIDASTGRFQIIEDGHVTAGIGRMKLNTR